MKYTKTEKTLIEAMEEMEIVDAHEHLPPEKVRTDAKVDALTLFSHYTRTDLITSGMSSENYNTIIDSEKPLDERWKMFEPHLEYIRYGSYAQPAFIAAKEFYGFDDINGSNYKELSKKMQEMNTPGIYNRILREKCKIRIALTQTGSTDYQGDLLIPLMPLDSYAGIRSAEDVSKRADSMDMTVSNLDDYLELAKKGVAKLKSEGAIGLKMASIPNSPPSREAAEKVFRDIMAGKKSSETSKLWDFLMNYLLDVAAEMDMVVAVHAGMWGDFRQLDSKHMIPVFPRHPNTKFDLYHLGMPSVRDTIVIGKNFPNVWLNICWCHIISQQMTCSALDECIDMVPMNKIIGFGGDYNRPVEKVYGHLLMAREDIAAVLGRRIDREMMSIDEAKNITKKWLWDNPRELYKLSI
ncbi:amidohydrolase family protein [Candidatus Poribacteria bacterium]|nr:amidohydrolase family protein [Candidatus Poribacteria bacterium]